MRDWSIESIGLTKEYGGKSNRLLAVDGLRRTFMNGENLFNGGIMQLDLVALLAFIAIMLPISLQVFAWAYRRARRQGTLGQYLANW